MKNRTWRIADGLSARCERNKSSMSPRLWTWTNVWIRVWFVEIKKPGRGWNLVGVGGDPEFYSVHITYEMPLRHHPGGVKDGHKNVKLKGEIGVGSYYGSDHSSDSSMCQDGTDLDPDWDLGPGANKEKLGGARCC